MENNIRPPYYGGKDNPFEVQKVIKNWRLGFDDGNALKYIVRAGKKDPNQYLSDLCKAITYLDFLIADYHLPLLALSFQDVNIAVCAWNFTSTNLSNAVTCMAFGQYRDAKKYLIIETEKHKAFEK